MNILREIRKIKNNNIVIKIALILVFSTIFIINTYAWWNLSKEIKISKVEGKINPWDVDYVIDNNNILDEIIKIPIKNINPGMENFHKIVKIKNTGNKPTKINFELLSVKLFGEEKLNELLRNDEILQKENGAEIFKNKDKYPFDFSYTFDKTELLGQYIDDRTTDSYANLVFDMKWEYLGTDMLDTEIGKRTFDFYNSNNNKNAIEITIKLISEKKQ